MGPAAEGEKQEVTIGVEELKQTFRMFEAKHFLYHMLQEGDFDAIDASDNYFFEVQGRYI